MKNPLPQPEAYQQLGPRVKQTEVMSLGLDTLIVELEQHISMEPVTILQL